MGMGISTVLLLLLTALSGVAQTPMPGPARKCAAAPARQENSTLILRSEMQQPKPIPTVNPLRYPEIPAAPLTPGISPSIVDNTEHGFPVITTTQPASNRRISPTPAE